MKFKIFITLLFLAGSAFAQLIPIREESGFLSSSTSAGSLFTLSADEPSIPYQTYRPAPASLSIHGSFSAMSALNENPSLGASPHGVRLHDFAEYPTSGAGASSFSTVLDLAPFTEATRVQSDSSPISYDQGVFTSIAAATIP
jgi:hypothetical protein